MNVGPLRSGLDVRGLEACAEALAQEDERPDALPRWEPGQPAVLGRQYRVSLDHIEDNPNNARVIYSDHDIAAVTESLVRMGQLQAVLAWSRGDQAMVLVEGHTRARAQRRAGLRELRLEVVAQPPDALADYCQSRELNVKRKNVSLFDDAVRFKQLIDTQQVTQARLAQLLDVGEEYVSKVLKVGRLPRLLLERMAVQRPGAFGLASAYLVAQFFELLGVKVADRLVSRIVEEQIPVRRLEQMLAEAKAAQSPERGTTPRRLRPLSRSVVSGAASGELKLFPDGRIELALSQIDQGLSETLYGGIVQVFADSGLEISGLVPGNVPDDPRRHKRS